MYFDRFDIAEAWYLFLIEYHGGQWSRGYSRLCKLQRSYTPGALFSYETLTENSRIIYNNLVHRSMIEKDFPN